MKRIRYKIRTYLDTELDKLIRCGKLFEVEEDILSEISTSLDNYFKKDSEYIEFLKFSGFFKGAKWEPTDRSPLVYDNMKFKEDKGILSLKFRSGFEFGGYRHINMGDYIGVNEDIFFYGVRDKLSRDLKFDKKIIYVEKEKLFKKFNI